MNTTQIALTADIFAARSNLEDCTARLRAEVALGPDASDRVLADLRDEHDRIQDRLCDLLAARRALLVPGVEVRSK